MLEPCSRPQRSAHAVSHGVPLQGDACTSCGMPFVRSFLTFEHLPVVEFHLAPGITDAEVGVQRVSIPTSVES